VVAEAETKNQVVVEAVLEVVELVKILLEVLLVRLTQVVEEVVLVDLAHLVMAVVQELLLFGIWAHKKALVEL